MKHELAPNTDTSPEYIEQLFECEIKKALSLTWAKTTQELLPGYLPDKPTRELSKDELALYRSAYKILGDMVERDEVEAIFEERRTDAPPNPLLISETIARPKFKLKPHGGKRSRNEGNIWQGGLATDQGL